MENVNIINKIKVVYKDYLDVSEELADLYIGELKKYYNQQAEKSRWSYGYTSDMTSKSNDELGISKTTLYLNLLPQEERQKFLQKVKWYFQNRDDIISITNDDENDEEKPQRYSLTICVWHKDTAKDLLKFYVKALKYHYPNAVVKNYFPIVTKQDVKNSLENRFDDNSWTGEILLLVKRKKRNMVKISEYTWYKKERMLVLSLSCLPKSKQKEFIKKAKQIAKDNNTKIQVL
jgi:hypothetical protein